MSPQPITNRGTGAPTHTAKEGTIYQDASNGKTYRNTDGGTTWKETTPTNIATIQEAVETSQQTVGNTTSEITIFSKTITGGNMGANGVLRLKAMWNASQDSGGDLVLTIRVKLGSTTFLTMAITHAAEVNVDQVLDVWIGNLNSESAQRAAGSIVADNDSVDADESAAGAEDTSGNLTLAVTAQWSALPIKPSLRMNHAVAYIVK
jgi:hypothetical protein